MTDFQLVLRIVSVIFVVCAILAAGLKDEKRYPDLFADEANDAAVEKAPTSTGWEQVGVECSAKSQPLPTKPHNVDVTL